MKYKDLKSDILRKLEDLNDKIQDLKTSKDAKLAQEDDIRKILQQLETIRGNILVQYFTIMNNKNEDEVKMPEVQKNLSDSFSSFESTYSKAGSLITQGRFSKMDRADDFKSKKDPKEPK